MSFEKLVSKETETALGRMGIVEPTEIQALTVPKALEGKDVVAMAPTGTGKTLAYLLPIIERFEEDSRNVQGIVLTPTYELAAQVQKVLNKVCKDIKTVLIIGSHGIKRQLDALKEKPGIVIGSPGRVAELIRIRKLSGHYVKTIVLDEADRLLSGENVDFVRSIIKSTLKDRQILMFSASITGKTRNIAAEIMKEPVFINAKDNLKLPENLEHGLFICERRDKIKVLRKIVHAEKVEKALVFLNRPDDVDLIADRLNHHGVKCEALHGASNNVKRKEALEGFREGRVKILVASDMAARGLDIKGLTHIVNFDMPGDKTIYLHRAGRVGRMANLGVVFTLASAKEAVRLEKIAKSLGISLDNKTMAYGEIKSQKRR